MSEITEWCLSACNTEYRYWNYGVQVWSAGTEYRVQSAGASLGKCRVQGVRSLQSLGLLGIQNYRSQMHRVWSAKPHRYRMQNASTESQITECKKYRVQSANYRVQECKNASARITE
jgi:hypothetical protein